MMNDAKDVLARIQAVAASGASRPRLVAALVIASDANVHLQDETCDVKRVRQLAQHGEETLGVSTNGRDEPPCETALRHWFTAMKLWGRGVFDGVVANHLAQAVAVLETDAKKEA